MANGGNIQFGIQFNTNKQSLVDVQNLLKEIQNMTLPEFMSINKGLETEQAKTELSQLKSTISEVQKALKSAFNINLNSININKFNTELDKSEINLQDIYKACQQAGQAGQAAFTKMTSSLLTTNVSIRESHKLLDQMANTLGNTIRFGISSSIFNNIANSISKAYSFSKELNTSLNNIRIVTNKSSDDMAEFAIQANKVAKALGQTTTAYTDAALIYYQQGLGDQEVAARTDVTLKAANVTGQTASEVSEQLTAVWNGYKVNAEETEAYVDRLAAVAAASASDLEELSTGISKVASAANTAGVNIDQLTAQVATITSVTREAPETVGNSLKTLYARFGDLAINGVDEFGVSLGTVSGKLESVGVKVLDDSGNMREMGDIFEDLASKWETWTSGQKQAVAVAVAGKMQYSRLMTLMENWDMYENMLDVSQNSLGALQNQQDIYMESTEAHLQQLTASWERLYNGLLDDKAINSWIDGLTTVVDLMGNFVDATGKGNKTLLALGALGTKVFGKQIAQGLATTITNRRLDKQDAKQSASYRETLNTLDNMGVSKDSEVRAEILKQAEQRESLYNKGLISGEEYNQMNDIIKNATDILILEENWNKATLAANEYLQTITGDKTLDLRKMTSPDDSDYDEAKNKNEEVQQQIKSAQELIKDVQKDVEKLYEEESKILLDDIKDFTDDMEKINKVFKNDDSLIEWGTQIELFKETVEENPDFLKNIINKGELQNYLPFLDKLNEKLNEIYKNGENAREKLGAGGQRPTTPKEQKNKDDFNEQKKRLQEKQLAQNLTEVTQGITNLTSSAMTFLNIPSIFANQDLTTGEKFLQIIMALTTAVPMLTMGWKSLTTGLNGIAVAHINATTGATLQAGANIGLATTLKAVAAAAWAAVAPLLPFIAIGAALVGTVYAINKAFNAESDAAKELSENLSKVKSAYSDLSSSVSEYKSARSGIDSLTEGTLEWYEAIQKANEAAQELIDKWNLIAGQDYTIDTTGKITIDEDVIEEKLFASMQNIYRLQATQSNNQEEQYLKEREKVLTNFYNDVNKKTEDISIKLADKEQARKMITKDTNNKVETSQVNPYLKYAKEQFQSLKEDLQPSKDSFSKLLSSNLVNVLNKISNKDEDLANRTIEIQKEMSEYLAEYNKLNQEYIAAQRETSMNLIRGYATKESVDKINNMTQNQQNIIADSITKYREDYSKSISQDLDNKLGKGTYGQLIEGMTTQELGIETTNNTILNQIGSLIAKYSSTRGFSENKLKEEYAKQELGYKKENGQWIDKNGNKIDKDEIKDLDASMVKDYFTQGLSGLNNYTNDILKTISDSISESASKGFGANSQEYIAEAKTAMLEGKTDYNYEVLNYEERIEALQQLNEEIERRNINLERIDEITQAMQKIGETAYDEQARATQDLKNYNAELERQASSLGTTSDALKIYGNRLQAANSDLKQNGKELATTVANSYGFNKAYNESVDLYEKNEHYMEAYSKALKNNEEISYDTADAIAELKTSLKDMFGMDVPITTLEKHFDDIQILLTGTAEQAEQAFNRIQESIRIDYAAENLKIDLDTAKQFIQDLDKVNPGEELPDKLNEQLLKMVNSAELTAQQLTEIFGNLNLEVPPLTQEDVTFKEHTWTAAATQTVHRYSGEYPTGIVGKDGKMKTAPIEYEWLETTEPKEEKFVTLGDNTKFKTENVSSGGGTKSFAPKNFTKSPSKSSSSGSTKDPKKEDKVEDEKDRYHDVNIQLKQIETNLGRLEKQQEKLFGQKLIDNYNAQWNLLNNQITTTNEKIKIANEEMKELQGKLSAQGVTFNDDGTMANYAAAYDAQLAYLNSIIDKYNAMSAEEQEAYQDTLDTAKDNFDKFVENMERYDEVVSELIPELQDDIQDAIDKQIEINISKFNMEIDLRLNIKDAQDKWNEFRRTILKDLEDTDFSEIARDKVENDFSDYYNADATGIIQAGTRHVNEVLEQLKQMDETGISAVYGDNRTAALEDLQTYYEGLIDNLEEQKDLIEEIRQAYLDTLDDVQEKMDKQLDTYEQIKDLINHDMKLIELVYGEESYAALGEYYQKQQDNYNKTLDFQRQQVQFWEAQMNAAEEGSDAWDSAREKWAAAVEDWRSTVEEAVENVVDKYENAINDIFQKLNNQVTSGKGLDYVKEEWDLINQNADQYLDAINSAYGIQKLQNKYLDAIDNTDSVSAQRKLNQLMQQEVKALQEKDKLTEYDVERANMKYEIALKQIALEEAQQNKSSMRLRRDSQGNYSYQFTADDEAVNGIQDELSDLLNQLYNFDLEHYRDNLDQMYSIWEEYQEKMAEAALINDPEQRAEREKLIYEQYGELINGIVAENEVLRANLQESAFDEKEQLYNVDTERFQNMIDDQDNIIIENMVPQWTSGVQDMINVFAGEGGFVPVCQESMSQLNDVTEQYNRDLEQIQESAGLSFSEINNGLDNTIPKIEKLLGDNKELMDSYNQEVDEIRKVEDELDSLIKKYQDAEAAAKAATEAAYAYWLQENKEAANAAKQENQSNASGTTTSMNNSAGQSNTSGSGGSGSGSTGGSSNNSDKAEGVAAAIWILGGQATGWYNGNDRVSKLTEKFGSNTQVQSILNSQGPSGQLYAKWNNKRDELWNKYAYGRFYTGGYTGDWAGDDGKIAMLDKKEIVLNKDDTGNLLDAIYILRNMTGQLGNGMLNQLSKVTASSKMNSFSEPLEQNVHIEANFPGVTSSHEIEDAINNLVNVASQRMNRKTL